MSPYDSSGTPRRPARGGFLRGHYGWFLALLVALMVGLVVGGVVVAVFSGGDDITVTRAAPPTSTSPATGPGGVPSSGADVQLSKSCLRAVGDAQRAYAALSAVGAAARDLDFGKLDDIVRRVQVLQRDLTADLQACRAGIKLPSGSAPGSSR